MGCFPCNNLQPEVAHLNACYPPSKALLTSGPEYRPLSQDLSKLTYFATNKPSKLAKIGEELEKRIAKECQRSTAGYPKYRASLLISLSILKSLLIECKRDLSLFARPSLNSISLALDVKVYNQSNGNNNNELDLEVIERASIAFVQFTTFTDGTLIGIDEGITRIYLDILRKFANMAIYVESKREKQLEEDKEQQNRTRLIALSALKSSILSDSLYSSENEFQKQINIILPPLLINLFEDPNRNSSSIEDLKFQASKIELDHSSSSAQSPYFNDDLNTFSKRPINARRAPSLHAHIPGEKGPTNQDVLNTCLKSLNSLISQSKVSQATIIIDTIINYLDKTSNWKDIERCCWLFERITAWIILQYRFVVPTRLIEILIDQKDIQPTSKHTSILSMVITILNSTTSLVGLGVSDLLGNLISLIIRRIKFDQRDSLLPSLVQCISALGTHIYYADQINDIIEEISIRIAEIQINDKNRSEIIRVLITCMIGVMITADQGDQEADFRMNGSGGPANEDVKGSGAASISLDKGKSPASNNVETPLSEVVPSSQQRIKQNNKSSRRNPISPEVWQETLPLLCEADFSVRITYSRALLLFLDTELPRSSINNKPSSSGKAPNSDPSIYRFCNALNASIYTLLMSNCLSAGISQFDEQSNVPSPEVGHGSTPIPPPADQSPKLPPTATNKNGTSTPKDNLPGERNGSISGKEKGVSFNLISPTPNSNTNSNSNGGNSGSLTPTKRTSTKQSNRRPSLPVNRVQSSINLSSFDNVATPYDFSFVLKILDELFILTPVQALVTGVPMLLSLDKDAGNDLIRRSMGNVSGNDDGKNGSWVLERKRAIRELVCLIWKRIGERWDNDIVEEVAQRALASLPEPFVIPSLPPYTLSATLELPEAAVSFVPHTIEGESSSASKPLLDPEMLLNALTGSTTVQNATGIEANSLRKRWESKWSVESAVKDSIERFATAHVKSEDHEIHSEIANVLMSMNNGSYQSFGNVNGNGIGNGHGNKFGSRTIDVGDLREALGRKTDDPIISSPPSIISNNTTYLSQTQEDQIQNAIQRSISSKGGNRITITNNQDVKEVLKDIFKDKKRASGVNTTGSGLPHGAHRIRTVSASSGLGKSSIVNDDNAVPGGINNGTQGDVTPIVSSNVNGEKEQGHGQGVSGINPNTQINGHREENEQQSPNSQTDSTTNANVNLGNFGLGKVVS